MARWTKHPGGALRRWLAAGLLVGLAVVGCSKGPAQPDAPKSPAPQPGASAEQDEGTKPDTTAALPPAPVDWRHLPFPAATRGGDDPPGMANCPPDTILAADKPKPVYQVLNDVKRLWDGVRFVAPNGHRIDYTAIVETDFGPIEIALRPDRAPNHVRNFVALARAGYYDGLHFDRIVHEVSPDGTGEPFDAVEGGCPLGTGEPEGGSIGYWLKADLLDPAGKPVAVDPLPHEEGAVGASHGTDRDSAGCKFYITLCKAPFLDGNYTVFGKVTRGLDVARTMFHQPVVADEENPASGHDRPQKPIVIRKVTIATREATEDK